MNDMSLIQEFVQEAREYIDEVEPTLIEIYNGSEESAGTVDAELVNSVFRMFHSMKGSAGFLSLSTIAGVTHEAETLLNEIRNGKLSLSVQITATLCKAIDLFRAMLDHIEETGADDGFDDRAEAIKAVLRKHVAGEPVDESMIANIAPAPEGEGETIPSQAAGTNNTAAHGEELSFESLANEKPPEPHNVNDLNFGEQPEEAAGGFLPPAPVSPPSAAAPDNVPPPAEPPKDELVQLSLAPEMRQSFVVEGNEQLDSCEQSLLMVLDPNAEHTEPIKDAFRYIHSFKGNCGFMGLVQLEHLSHTMETLLDKLRNSEITPSEENAGVLLKKLDALREGVRDIENGGNGLVANLDGHVHDLNVLLGVNEPTVAPSAQPAVPVPPQTAAAKLTGIDAEIAAAESEQAAADKIVADAQAKGDMDLQIEWAFKARDAKEKVEALKAKKASGGTTSNGPVSAKPAAPSAGQQAPAANAVNTPPAPTGNVPNAAAAAAAKKQDIRVDLHKLDVLINLVGELVIAESMVTRCPAVSHVEDEYYNRAKHQLRRICDDLQDVAMSVRMIPLSATFRKMIRLVHDLATKTGKKIKLDLLGEDTEVDKTVIEQIADPLVHIVRNSCDHGIEPPDERLTAGKPDTGSVILEGKHEGGEVWIIIKDDGHGLNREKIISKALERGLVGDDVKNWSDDRVFKLIFEPGFSTADKVTDVSGRGVGMDVVKRNIEKLNGRIDITSKKGQGSTFTLRIPLTLAIVDAMLVRVGAGKYMIPTLTIRESLVPTKQQITVTPEGREILRLREEMVPVIRLYDVFCCEPGATKLKDGILIVAEDGGRSFAFFVDEIIGQQQTVIKGLPEYLGDSNGFSGCTILGDGTVSLIVDVGAVSQMQGSFAASAVDKEQYWRDDPKDAVISHEVSFADLEASID
ncbi:MAG: chemotaxis protein CheA [Planctomycetaceae bacterium]|jgi:two-component system chemotaxis sensor kinase CheA|nr:chemotaxis protein CheA [Planctomycetaceae bacterium]